MSDTLKCGTYHTLVHYSDQAYDELRPLSYNELVTNRTAGRWAGQPEQAQKYVLARKQLERLLHRRLQQKAITTNPDNTFLYATLAGHSTVPSAFGNFRHEVPLTDDIINQSFFDVVGDGRFRTAYGKAGLNAALKRWEKAKQIDNLKTTSYMGMPIHPRVEIMTAASIKPTIITELAKQAAQANFVKKANCIAAAKKLIQGYVKPVTGNSLLRHIIQNPKLQDQAITKVQNQFSR